MSIKTHPNQKVLLDRVIKITLNNINNNNQRVFQEVEMKSFVMGNNKVIKKKVLY